MRDIEKEIAHVCTMIDAAIADGDYELAERRTIKLRELEDEQSRIKEAVKMKCRKCQADVNVLHTQRQNEILVQCSECYYQEYIEKPIQLTGIYWNQYTD